MSKRKFAAVDQVFLLALAEGDTRFEEIVDWLNKKNYHILIPSTVLQSLEDIAISGDKESKVAAKALGCITNWTFLTPELGSVENGLAGIGVSKLESSGLLPEATEPELQYLLEAALHNCSFCFTGLSGLIGKRPDAVRMTLLEADLGDPLVVPTLWFSSEFLKSKSRK